MVLIKETPRDLALVGLVCLLALAANMPEKWAAYFSLDRKYVLAGLIAVLGVAVVRYLKFSLVLIIVVLVVGANLPEDIAKEFGIDPLILLLTLLAVIIASLANRFFFKLPTGMEKTGRTKSAHGAAALFNAILKGRIASVQSLLAQGVDVNVRTVSGKTPLMAAAFKGYSDIVQLLIENGADPNIRDARGDSALKIATRGGFTRAADLLKGQGARD